MGVDLPVQIAGYIVNMATGDYQVAVAELLVPDAHNAVRNGRADDFTAMLGFTPEQFIHYADYVAYQLDVYGYVPRGDN